MNPRRGSHSSSPHNLNDLLKDSIPDRQSPETDINLHSRPIHPGDPFSSPLLTGHGPWRTLQSESPGGDQRGIPEISTSRPVAIHYPPTAVTLASRRPDNIGYPTEDLRTTNIVDRDRKNRRPSLEGPSAYSTSPSVLTHEAAGSGYTSHHLESPRAQGTHQSRRRPLNQDEFDGPIHLLSLPSAQEDQLRAQALPDLPIHLSSQEQDEVLRIFNETLSICAFHFVAKYQFPIPIERDKPPIRHAFDRDWTEWAYLIKRLATKRRIPARVLHENQIKHLVTVLENSIPIRNTRPREAHTQERVMRDDRYVLQLFSAGIQVTRLMMDSMAMQELIKLYDETEAVILKRR